MGVVYRARDPIINRLVALKTITTGLADDPKLLERFYREAQSAGGLQHPNIVTIYDMGDEENTPFIAMELIEGESLEQIIANRTNLPLVLKVTYALQACRAFDYAHKRGIIHRDIKPGNVMVNKERVVKVVDFGIARVLDTSKTQTGMLIGTFAYMSPEQYHGEHADERSDIWSFGVTLYELLCYKRPFSGENPASLMHSICQQEPRSLSDLVPECPPAMAAIISKLLRKSPQDRCQSMEDLLLELEPVYKELQSRSVAELIDRSRQLIVEGEFAQARELLRESVKLDSANSQARALLEKVNAELRRILIRPKVLQHVEKAGALLSEGRIQEARAEVENGLQLDSSFEPAQELLKRIQHELDRAQTIAEWLRAIRQRLAEGMPDEAEALFAKLLELDPSNKNAGVLQQQIQTEKAERKRRQWLLEKTQQARALWTDQKYEGAAEILTALQKEFPHEDEIQRLLETVLEDQAEQYRQNTLQAARNLLAGGKHAECRTVLLELHHCFPNDDETFRLLEDVRLDEAKQHRSQILGEVRSCIAGGRYQQSIELLESLEKEFPDDEEVSRLLQSAREDQAEQRRQQGVAEARTLLAARRYEDCDALLGKLREQFPNDAEIPELVNAVREGQAEQRKLKSLAEARDLLAGRRYDEAVALLESLAKEFRDDEKVSRLLQSAREDQAEQRRQRGVAEARALLAARRYEDCDALLGKLREQFPNDAEIPELVNAVREGQAEQRKLKSLAEARDLLAGRRYDEAVALLESLAKEFRDDEKVSRLLQSAREDQAEQRRQQGVAEARTLLAARRYEDCDALLGKLREQFPNDAEIPELVNAVREGQAEQRKLKSLAEARDLLAGRRYDEAVALLESLAKEFRDDEKVSRLLQSAREDQAEQRRQQGVAEARTLLAARRYEDCDALLGKLREQFPNDAEIPELVNAVREGQAEQRKLKSLAEARDLLAARRYDESIALLAELKKEFPREEEISRLSTGAHEAQLEQRKTEGLAEARNLHSLRRYEDSIALLTSLQKEFPKDREVPRLLANAVKEQAEQQKQQKLSEARALLAAQRFPEALALLDALGAEHTKDGAIQKLRSLVERERDKKASRDRLERELETLRVLVGQKKYSDVLSRAATLEAEFPGNTDLVRLVEFARSQQSQIEVEIRLRGNIDEVKAHFQAARFTEAIRAADSALKDFPENAELLYLLEQAKAQETKQRKRKLIEQRIREIKFKINRENFSEAIELAKVTLETTGPDADLTQLLNSAIVEVEAREKKRRREQKLQEIRGLVESGNIDQAAETLHDALSTTDLDEFDPRVSRISQEIEQVRSSPTGAPAAALPSGPVNFSKEYAFLQGAPAEVEPSSSEKTGPVETLPSHASTNQSVISSSPTVPVIPLQPDSITATPVASEVGASTPGQPTIASHTLAAQPPELTKIQPEAGTATASEDYQSSGTADLADTALIGNWPPWRRLVLSDLRKPAALGLFLGLILVASLGVHFISSSKTTETRVSPATENPNAKASPSAEAATNSAETQQRIAIDTADKLIASGDLRNALQSLQDAENLNGPLTADIKNKEVSISESMRDQKLAKIRQQEAILWQQATDEVNKSEFELAKRDLRKILGYGEGSVRRDDAQKYLEDVIPRRQKEEALFQQAAQNAEANDLQSLQRAADLYAQVVNLGGPRKAEAEQLKRNMEARLSSLQLENARALIENRTTAARKDIQQGDLNGARQNAEQIRQAGGDASALLKEIDQAQANQLRAAQLQKEFEQALQRYNAVGSRDKNGLEKSRSDFQAIVAVNGAQTAEAQRYLTEINTKLDALNQPPPPPPAVKTQPADTAGDDIAIRALIQSYAQAFEHKDANALRQIWPTIGNRYTRYKDAFEKASSIRLKIDFAGPIQESTDGLSATVKTLVSQDYEIKGTGRTSRKDTATFQLTKAGGIWAIADVR